LLSHVRYYNLKEKKRKRKTIFKTKRKRKRKEIINRFCQIITKLHARIKPTALCSAFDKENSVEFLLDSIHYLYMKSNPNPFFIPTLPYESLSSHTSIDEKENKIK